MKSLIKGYGGEKMLGYTVPDNRLTDDGKVIVFIYWPPVNNRKITATRFPLRQPTPALQGS
jgi:hypothetical protein